MRKKIIMLFLLKSLCALFLFSQTDFEYNLLRTNSNKIILLGDWNPRDISKWRDVIDSDGVFEHGFVLVNRALFSDETMFGIKKRDVAAFEGWIRREYGLSASAKWIVLNMENKLITSGTVMPSPKEFDEILDQKGIRTPLKIVRAFLLENPEHLDAKADMLKEVRRRALSRLPANFEDLSAEADLKIWGVFAAETDNVFNGDIV